MDVQAQVGDFVKQVLTAMGLDLQVDVTDAPDAIRLDISGDGAEVLLKRKAEALDALQQLVNSGFRRNLDDDRSFVVDAMGYRRGKDAELREMARFMIEKAKTSGAPQEMGPLNPYARRIVHLAVAEDPDMTSESIGDAFMKTVIISAKKQP
jgi:spoIIIJ-associated protein